MLHYRKFENLFKIDKIIYYVMIPNLLLVILSSVSSCCLIKQTKYLLPYTLVIASLFILFFPVVSDTVYRVTEHISLRFSLLSHAYLTLQFNRNMAFIPHKRVFIKPIRNKFPEAKVWETIEKKEEKEYFTEVESDKDNSYRHSPNITVAEPLLDVDLPEAPDPEDESEFSDYIYNSKGDYIMSNSDNSNGTKQSNNSNNSKRPNRPKTYRNNADKLQSTGIKPRSFTVYEGNSQSDSAQLYLMSGALFSFPQGNTFANDEIDKILHKYNNVLQKDYKIDVDKTFTKEKIKDFLKCITESLELYLFLQSVVDYCDNEVDGNAGMFYIRQFIKADDLIDLKYLKNLLESMFMNPSFVTYMKKMYGNYSTNTSKLSPMIKICPHNLFLEANNNPYYFQSGKTIRAKFEKLRTYRFIAHAFSKLHPNWEINLSNFDYKKKFDSDFLAFWHNTSINYALLANKEAIACTREAKGLTDYIYLGVFANSTKSEYIASISINESIANVIQPGIFIPTNDYPMLMEFENRTSLHVYVKDKGIKGLKSLEDAVASFIYKTPYIDSNGNHFICTNKCQSEEKSFSTLNTLREYVHQTMQYIFLP